jgi:predicted nucleic acid-binding protein
MGQKFLIDTNSLIDFQTRKIPHDGLGFIAKTIDDSFIISFITYIEFLGYKDVSQSMENFIALATIIEVNKPIINQTILLRKAYRIKLPDAIIAATAIVHNLTLISHNTKDFVNIKGLPIFDPYSL